MAVPEGTNYKYIFIYQFDIEYVTLDIIFNLSKHDQF